MLGLTGTSRKPLAANHRDSAFHAIFGAVFVRQAYSQGTQPALAFVLEVVTRTNEVVEVVIQMLVQAPPKPGVPVAFKTEVLLIGKLKHRSMSVRLRFNPKGT